MQEFVVACAPRRVLSAICGYPVAQARPATLLCATRTPRSPRGPARVPCPCVYPGTPPCRLSVHPRVIQRVPRTSRAHPAPRCSARPFGRSRAHLDLVAPPQHIPREICPTVSFVITPRTHPRPRRHLSGLPSLTIRAPYEWPSPPWPTGLARLGTRPLLPTLKY